MTIVCYNFSNDSTIGISMIWTSWKKGEKHQQIYFHISSLGNWFCTLMSGVARHQWPPPKEGNNYYVTCYLGNTSLTSRPSHLQFTRDQKLEWENRDKEPWEQGYSKRETEEVGHIFCAHDYELSLKPRGPGFDSQRLSSPLPQNKQPSGGLRGGKGGANTPHFWRAAFACT